ncbi:protein-tyrosine phosphatase family protein [Polyangium jinanense]|nr:protein-tyrosine phosphatase family protein [Polyangium jinanense]
MITQSPVTDRTEGRSPGYATAFLTLSCGSMAVGVIDWRMLLVFGWPALSWALVGFAYLWPGAGIFEKRGARLTWHRKLLLLPHMVLLYATWHAVRALSREPAFARLGEDILIGRRLLPGEFPAVRTVVDLAAELDEHIPAGTTYLSCPILDGAPLPPDVLRQVAKRISAAPAPVYIHCAQGHGRTAMVASAVLLERGVATSVDAALTLVREARPAARPNRAQVQALLDAWAQVR